MFEGFVWILLSIAWYFVPTLVARARLHPHFTGIFLTNLLIGWTGVGWLVAIIWAAIKPSGSEEKIQN